MSRAALWPGASDIGAASSTGEGDREATMFISIILPFQECYAFIRVKVVALFTASQEACLRGAWRQAMRLKISICHRVYMHNRDQSITFQL